MDTVLYVPGRFQYDIVADQPLIDQAARKGMGFERIVLPHDDIVDEWVELVKLRYRQLGPKKTILVGFSLGAVVAYQIAAKEAPKKLVLASLPPWCKERINTLDESSIARFSDAQLQAFKKHAFDKLAPQIACQTEIFVGSKELSTSPGLWENVHILARRIPRARLTVVPGVAHEPKHRRYEKALAAAF